MVTSDVVNALAVNIATRVLAGGGDMVLVPYRQHTQHPLDVVTHGLDAVGNLVVSCLEDDIHDYTPLEVRADTILKSPQFHVDITAASTHALGTVQWFAVDGPWVRGVLDIETMHVHHVGYPTCFAVDPLRPLALGIGEVDADRVGAYDVVSSLGPAILGKLFDAVAQSSTAGVLCDTQPLNACAHTQHKLFIIDISSAGVTLLRTTDATRVTAHVALPRPARDFQDLANQLVELADQASGWHADSRI